MSVLSFSLADAAMFAGAAMGSSSCTFHLELLNKILISWLNNSC